MRHKTFKQVTAHRVVRISKVIFIFLMIFAFLDDKQQKHKHTSPVDAARYKIQRVFGGPIHYSIVS